ncbi:MAG: trp operon repressor [Candidatus Gastranaerophilales bacterium]|nr:trp operon repressor [Candidatus Gastranaerophilales bacterium]
MNRNKNDEIYELTNFVRNLNTKDEVVNFMIEILTKSELETLSKRWRILNMLLEGRTQREIAQELKVSLCKVTRGSKILKNSKSVVGKYLIKEKRNGNVK